MLKKTERLTKKEFDKYFKSGKRIHGDLLQLIYSPAINFNGAVVVGKKVHKKAVDRNKQRRRIYNALYQIHTDQELRGVYICIAKPKAATASYSDFKTELLSAIGRLHKTKVE